MKDALCQKIITRFVGLRLKAYYSYLINNDTKDKKAKKTKKCVIKRILKFNGYKKCLPNNEVTLKSQKWLKKIGLHWTVTMIKDYRLLIELHYIHMVQMQEKCVKQSC